MRSPDNGCARRPSPSGCRGYNICFGTAVGNPASQSQRLRRVMRYARSAAGDLCLRKKEGDPFCIRRPSGVMRFA